jgi:hypothetical protein
VRKTLIDQRTAWLQRLQAQLFHQGVPPGLKPRTAAGRDALANVELSPAGRETVELCLRMLDQLDRELAPIDRTLQLFARRQPGCRSLIEQLYGVGAVTATAIRAELGDARRFKSSDDAVRHSGLDVTVWQSMPCGQLPQCSRRQRPPALAGLHRPSGRNLAGTTPHQPSRRRTRSAHLDKAGRPRTPTRLPDGKVEQPPA